jgi:uncharacterized protein (DUF58 family)
VLTRRGWEAVAGTLFLLLAGLLTLNPVIELIGVAAFAFVATEVASFDAQLRAFGPEQFRVTRGESPRRMPSDGELHLSVEITYLGAAGFTAEIFEQVPDAFDPVAGSSRIVTWVKPGEPIRLAYSVRPRVRGAYVTGPAIVIARDALGLAYRRTSLPTDRPVTVVPPSIAGRLGHLGVALLSRVQSGLSVRRRGYGSEFRNLRLYQTSDDIRHVAWRRSTPEQLLVREFDQESRQEFLIVLDLSTAMDAGRWGRSALDVSVEAAALLTNLVARNAEDRIGLMTYGGGVFQFVPPGRGPAHLRRVVDNLALAGHRPGGSPLPDIFARAAERLRLPTHVFIFSAVEEPLEGLERSCAVLRARGHQPYVFIPERSGFYPDPPGAARTRALEWARAEEDDRVRRSVSTLRSGGIPVFPFGRSGAGDKVIFAYTQIRSWGYAR